MGKRREITEGDLVKVGKVPYADEVRALADRIVREVGEGGYDSIEEAGRLSLAASLSLYADGRLDPSQMYGFLKGLADRKTPGPIQRVEELRQVDMRVLVMDAVRENPGKLERAIELSRGRREEVRRRLGLGETLELGSGSDSGGDRLTGLPGEPVELGKIRVEDTD